MFKTSNAHTNKATKSTNLFNKGNTSFIQPKLNIGKPGDKYEVEADKMADTVVAKGNESTTAFIAPSPSIQKQSDETIQEKPLVESITPVVQLKPIDTIQKQPEEEVQTKEEEVQSKEDEKVQEKEEEDVQLKEEEIQSKEDEEVQTKEDEEIQEKEEEEVQKVQMKSSGEIGNTSIESNLNKGGGSPLATNTKNEMESGFGSDFGDVRVHNDSNAVQMNKNLGSQAFTNGNDIYFNEGKYNPSSDSGKHLLAHELTHTVQQGTSSSSSVQQKTIQKEENNTSDLNTQQTDEPVAPTNEYTHTEKGTINTQNKTIIMPSLPVPSFKAAFGPTTSFTIPKGGFLRNDNHTSHWITAAMSGTGFTTAFTTYAANSKAPNLQFNGQQIFYLTLKGGSKREQRRSGYQDNGDSGVIFGSMNDIKRRVSRPYWLDSGVFKPHQIDHKTEIQIGGAETDINNMWMLESSANLSSGGKIKNSRKSKVEELMHLGRESLINPPESYTDAKTNYTMTFQNGVVADDSLSVVGNPETNWELSQIQNGDHLSGLKFLTESEVDTAGLRGSPNELLLFTGLSGGLPIRIPWDEAANDTGRKDGLNVFIGRRGGAKILINSVLYNSSSGEGNQGGTGSIICTAFPGSKGLIRQKTNLAYTIRPMNGISYGGYIEKSSVVQANLHALNFKYMSPITLPTSELDDDIGMKARGTLLPSIPLIGDTEIELVIDEQGARLRKIFQKSDYNFPSPFEVKSSSLEVSAGTEGFAINGEMNFGINNVGEGVLKGDFSTERGFALVGEFNFDSKLFDPASVEVSYENEILTVTGIIGISEGKVRGVKSATVTATYSEGNFNVSGEAELDIPGVQQGTMEVLYNDEGFSIGGEFQLKNDIPGIRGGSVSAIISKQNGEEDYSIMVSGTAQPDIPGVNSSLTVAYDNGALTLEGNVAYSRGMLSGSVKVGATNKTIDENGEPIGDPGDIMRLYGGGSLTLQLTPWLAATADVKFLPNGEMEVTARLETDTYDVFPRKEFTKNLFTVPTIEIPLFAIPLGPRSVGLVAQIGGGLDFKAGFGPGQLRDLSAEITYNPDREDETTVAGQGEFGIPADAGLTLRGDLGLGVSVAVASISGGIELAGTLGLEGEALASVDVNWSPQTGLAIDANGSIMVNPKFTFDLNAFLRASLGIGFLSISETWRYNLASFEWGSDINFGINFPIHYREGESFDMSFDDIEVIYPEIDVVNIAKGVARDKKDEIID
ncbi:MAG: DUF4157 domain-containing protein [Flavobacteriaceae bacterium]|nr:DUF4157 domain-containing protein [Flavobacteriaceae bacterium]